MVVSPEAKLAVGAHKITLGSTVTAQHLIQTQDVNSVKPKGLLKPVNAVFPGTCSVLAQY